MTNFESEFDGKVAIVTGGAGSIGRAIAEALAEYGAEVHVFDRDHDAMQALAQGWSRTGAIKAHAVDVTKSNEVEQGVAEVVAGGHEVAILFNNAGIEDTHNHSVIDLDEALWNDKYGESRGTGALRREDGEWRIAHYSLTFPIPNDLAAEVTARIRASEESADADALE